MNLGMFFNYLILFVSFSSQNPHTENSSNFRAQTLMMNRLSGAKKGHRLLKKKADALQMRFRLILSKIVEVSRIRMNGNVVYDFGMQSFRRNC